MNVIWAYYKSHPILLYDDEKVFTMNNPKPKAGSDDANAIVLDDVLSGNSGVLPAPVESAAVADAIDSQQTALTKCNEERDSKKPAAVSPDDEKKKKRSTSKEIITENKAEPKRIKKIIVTRTVIDKDGNVVTTKTTEETDKPVLASAALCQTQSTLSLYGLAGKDKDGEKVISIYQAKVFKPKRPDALSYNIKTSLAGLDYVAVRDDPLSQEVAKLVKESDVVFLNIKEAETEDPEPRYFVFDGVKSKVGIGREEDTMNCDCEDCFIDACWEYLWGPYCVAAVERYFEENYYIATEKDAYVVYVAHLNRRLDAHSYDDSGAAERLRPTQISKPPHCMRVGSLTHCIKWIKWQRTAGPHASWYTAQRLRRQRNRQAAQAREQTENRISQMN